MNACKVGSVSGEPPRAIVLPSNNSGTASSSPLELFREFLQCHNFPATKSSHTRSCREDQEAGKNDFFSTTGRVYQSTLDFSNRLGSYLLLSSDITRLYRHPPTYLGLRCVLGASVEAGEFEPEVGIPHRC